jgi:death-on-curing protein
LPKNNNPIYRLSAALIENAHDFGIAMVWPGIEPVQESTCLDLNLLHSAAHQPYQHCFGRELYPTLSAKAAYLFVHIASGHIFSNGNKRTASLCIDAFALVNSCYLTLSNDEIQVLARSVASYRKNGITFNEVLESTTQLLEENLIPFSVLRKWVNPTIYRNFHLRKRQLRAHPLNQIDAPLRQGQ